MGVTVCDLINNKKTKFTEADRLWLNELAPEQLERMAPVEEQTNNQAVKPTTLQELLANADPGIRETIEEGQRTLTAKKTSLIETITANKKNVFTKEQLAAMPMQQLEATANLAKVETEGSPSFGIRPDPTANAAAGGGEIEVLEAPTVNWAKK